MGVTRLAGYWWLPGKKNDMVVGTLSIEDSNELRLDLVGCLNGVWEWQELKKYPIILGIADGKLFTLVDCYQTGSSISMPGFSSQCFRPTLAYAGAHFDRIDDMLFNELTVEYSHLTTWTGISGITPEYLVRDGTMEQYRVIYRPPETLQVALPDGDLILTHTFQVDGDGRRQITLGQTNILEYQTPSPKMFDDLYRGFIYPMQNLLSLATMTANYPVSVQVHTPQKTIQSNDGVSYPMPIKILFGFGKEGPPTSRQELISSDMLFCLQDIRNCFDRIMTRWFTIATELDSALEVFFAIQYNPRMYLEHRFLNSIQAIEVYHRCRNKNRQLPDDVHEKLVNLCVSAVPEQHENFIREALKYTNEPRLRHRIGEVTQDVKVTMSETGVETKRFIQKVIDTRNYLVHRDESLKNSVADGEELYAITQVLDFLFRECLLKELYFPDEDIRVLLTRNGRFRFWARRMREFSTWR